MPEWAGVLASAWRQKRMWSSETRSTTARAVPGGKSAVLERALRVGGETAAAGGNRSGLDGVERGWRLHAVEHRCAADLAHADPALLLSMTPFVRLLVVFHFLRQALGTQSTPTNQTLIGLALILTYFLMQPVGAAIHQTAIVPLAGRTDHRDGGGGARRRAAAPVHAANTCAKRIWRCFVDLAKEPRPARPQDLSMRVVVPAYILSELKAGFQIGAVLFLPFLVIDMVVAAITTSVGMLQLPPVVISTPLKMLLFVMVDGWNLLIGSLMRSFT